MIEDRVLIAGAGPVGLVAAAQLVRQRIPVTVFEAGNDLSGESRASTFHPPTLDMLDELGVARQLIDEGLKAPKLQYRSKKDGVIAQFDFGEISDRTKHPYRVQSEQFKLTRILLAHLRNDSHFRIEFGARLRSVQQDDDGVQVSVRVDDREAIRTGRWLIGADGARSEVRRSLGVEFEGFTWPERFLVLSTPFDFDAVIPDLVSVNYVADPECWQFLLRIPGIRSEATVLGGSGFMGVALGSVLPASGLAPLVAGLPSVTVPLLIPLLLIGTGQLARLRGFAPLKRQFWPLGSR